MEIGIKDAAKLLNLSEGTIYRWVKRGKLPGFKIGEQYKFNRAELLEWATSNQISISADIFSSFDADRVSLPSLKEALMAGGIYYRVGGSDKISALESAVDQIKFPDEVDKAFLLQVLMARESVGSTGIGDGIAIPHVRNPIVLHVGRPMVALCFLEHPVDFGAIDGKFVHTLFTIVSPSISVHLNLLSKIAFALHQTPFMKAINGRSPREEILRAASIADQIIAQTNSAAKEEA